MIDFRRLYEDNRGPLTEARNLVPNSLYITEDGTRIRYLGEDEGSMSFEIETTSPLNEGYFVSGLSGEKGGLPLFWKLLNKEYENTSNY